MSISRGKSYVCLVTRFILAGVTWNVAQWKVTLYRRSRINAQFGPFFFVL